ncbi:basic helix-loop-helix (bHLH) DNA-binding superfamily protein [Rhynchospora pubera]|uniref:Basic helix-loop-helix (BHLH) DNA-binding superfamily protein n=1 Tax=Rhynchospora pubera TaxID=906938 RepID=A0AAV8BUR7_9POAL|nr:basic helix-loop-helix (bHLH) DNA-binding superfamily protein [Rhynchospora pubera]
MEAPGAYQEEVQQQRFRRQLAAVVRNFQWSYAIFWSISTTQPEVLVWSAGYYNGDIKTRKTTQPMEFKDDEMGLERSEQLRELYISLSAGDTNQQCKRPSASLSPEDLTDTEWYYLVCMSFTFGPGRGLPGKVLASNEQIWLCNAQFADSKTFTRSLLAKSASMQTIVCVPFMNGVLELGTTEMVLEDQALIKHITTSFWEMSFPVCTEQSISSPPFPERDEENNMIDAVISPSALFSLPNDNTSKEAEELHPNIYEDLNIDSPDDSWKDPTNTQQMAGSFGFNTELIDDEFSNGVNGSLIPSECVFPKAAFDILTEKTELNLVSLDLDDDASYYANTLVSILKNSKELNSFSRNLIGGCESSFVVWRKSFEAEKVVTGASQKLLKKVLSGGTWINGDCVKGVQEGVGLQSQVWKCGVDVSASHVMSERRRREKLNEKFVALRSIVPSISKVDKASILGDTIEYVKELERRVEELESCQELFDHESRALRKNNPDLVERTSDNYCVKAMSNGKKISLNKRKVRDIDEAEAEQHWVFSKDSHLDINVTMSDQEALLVLHCQWREFLLLEILEAIGNLHLDPVSVQSSISESVLALTIKAKFIKSVVASPGMIKQSLQRVVGKC